MIRINSVVNEVVEIKEVIIIGRMNGDSIKV